MINTNHELETHNKNILAVLVGMLIGSLAGAVTMLLLAPQSGKRTRMQIQEKGIELRDQAIGMVENGVAQVRLDVNKIVRKGRRKANHLLHQAQSLAADQLEYVSDTVKAGKKAIQHSHA
jgi:gas vesicle protein